MADMSERYERMVAKFGGEMSGDFPIFPSAAARKKFQAAWVREAEDEADRRCPVPRSLGQGRRELR
jgi:hypothetical protein